MPLPLPKVFERLFLHPQVHQHITFAYRPNESTANAISYLLHTTLTPRKLSEILLMDYSSVFSTIVPLRYFPILRNLGLKVELCSWMFDLPTSTTGDAVCPVTLLSTLEPLKDGFWAPSCTHSAPMSVWPYQLLCHHHGTGFHLLSA